MYGTAYSQTITATETGGAGGPYTFAVASGILPPCLSLATGGTLSGTPTAAGPFSCTVTVSYSGFVLGQDPSVLSGTLTFSTVATTGSAPGPYTVTPGGLTSSIYAIQFVNSTLTIISYSQATTNLQAQVDQAGLAHGMQSPLNSQLQAASACFAAGDIADGVS